ncbi:MAG TPA: biotin--[acetyl-CoA-carboxylase] ligase [Limnochordia bacterium]|nr:biotin--[acetyl-CoA-carboxylase] ligase [Limnochordia bacterium]
MAALVAAPGGAVSGETLRRRLGVSRAAVWKRIERLRAVGFAIEAVPGRGYLWAGGDASLAPWSLAARAPGLICAIEYYERVGSTNDVVKRRGAEGAPEGLLVLAETQHAGRGRLGRSWHSPSGKGIWASLLLRPRLDPFGVPNLTLLTAAAVAAAIEAECGLDARIKWPNDVLIHERKVCGILVEMAAELGVVGYVAVGFGINVDVPAAELAAVSDWATSLAAAGCAVERSALLVRVLAEFERRYRAALQAGFAGVIAENRARSATIGRMVRVIEPHGEWSGRAEAIEDDGALVVVDRGGAARRVRSGEVSLRPDAAKGE